MKIVHFDQMFHPEFGDQINILPKLQVKLGHEVFIVTGKTDVPHPRFIGFADNSNMDEKDRKYTELTGVKILRIDIYKFVSGRAIYKKGYRKIIDDLNPDILFCHFNDTVVGMEYTLKSSRLNYPVVFDSHMLDIASENKFKKIFRIVYRLFITPIIVKNQLIVIRTQDDDYVNKELGIPSKLTPFLSFGSDTTLFYPSQLERENFRAEYNISSEDFVVLYTGKINKIKGLDLLLNVFNNEFKTVKNIILVLVGGISEEYKLEFELNLNKSTNRIVLFNTQKYINLPKFYQMADLCVFPKQCSLSFYDAQACGLPVVAENIKINIDRLANENGKVYECKSVVDLKKVIEEFANMDSTELFNYRKNARRFIEENYDYMKITERYNEIIEDEIKKFKKKI